MRGRGIVLNREVEIRKGEETDIHVEAIPLDTKIKPEDAIRTIIEVKGCWNEQILTDVENQLHDRYMKNNTKTGIYVIGWFHCEKWDKDDYRSGKRGASKIKGDYSIENVNSTLSD